MVRILPLVLMLGLVLTYGIAEGLWTNRWNFSHDAEKAAERLERFKDQNVAMNLGEWEGKPAQMPDREFRLAEIDSYVSRRYTHAKTGSAISVLIVCGQPGPVAVHTPEVCYGGAGFNLAGAAVRKTLAPDTLPKPVTFWKGKFVKTGAAVPEQLAIYWSWSASDEWTAADNPRLAFAARPFLYKVYVTMSLSRSDEVADEEQCAKFLEMLLPELHKHLLSPSEA